MARHHWIITLQWHDAEGQHTKTLDGTWNANPSDTRQDIYRHALRWSTERLDAERADPAVLLFDTAPDQL
ncbi:hypothetical protein [Streptomyces tremellae]|uniref:Transposase n=1 Tax=Streptomyces tremellae TaxID=1124239 RepID=A0ABP7F145_9ACTN